MTDSTDHRRATRAARAAVRAAWRRTTPSETLFIEGDTDVQSALPRSQPAPPGWVAYGVALNIPLVFAVSVVGEGWWTFALPVHIFAVLPLLEALVGRRRDGAAAELLLGRARVPVFTWLLRGLAATVFLGLVAAIARADARDWTLLEQVGLACSAGSLLGALGITIAHELGHRRNLLDRGLAQALLHASWYPHFHVEHNRGHHVRVATPADPASARPGESLYRFLPRAVVGGFVSAFEIGARPLRDRGEWGWTPANPVVRMVLVQLAAAALVGQVFGATILLFWMAAGAIGVLHLEVVDYIEHYGLTRRRLADGGYEPVSPRHSWNSDHLIGRLTLFELPRHSDHHAQAARPYQSLRSLEGAPQMPAGYPAMMLLALVPPLWARIMDPRVEAWRAEQPPLTAP